jgi:hypothetical protein
MMPVNLYPKLNVAAQRLLSAPDDRTAVAAAVTRWKADDLEQAAEDAGVRGQRTQTIAQRLGRCQGVTDQVEMSRNPGRYRTILVPHGSSRPEWLPRTSPN